MSPAVVAVAASVGPLMVLVAVILTERWVAYRLRRSGSRGRHATPDGERSTAQRTAQPVTRSADDGPRTGTHAGL